MADKITVLLLTASIGAGHVRAAQAVAEALVCQYPQARVQLVDVMAGNSRSWKQWVKEGYYTVLERLPEFYNWLYHWSDKQHSVVRLADYMVRRSVYRILEQSKPDVILAMHPFAAIAAGECMGQVGLEAVQLGTVLTDYGAHRMWTHPAVNDYFVGTTDMKKQLVHYKVAPDKVKVTGIPASQTFCSTISVEKLRKQLRLDNNLATVMLMGGGIGLAPLLECLASFEKEQCGTRMQLVVLVGHNAQLYADARRVSRYSRHRIIVRGFTRRVADYMRIADILVTKPGGMTVTEATMAGLPLVLLPPLPGPETENARFFADYGGAVLCTDSSQCCDAVRRIIENPFLQKAIRQKMLDLSKADAAKDIAEWAIQAAWQKQGVRLSSSAG